MNRKGLILNSGHPLHPSSCSLMKCSFIRSRWSVFSLCVSCSRELVSQHHPDWRNIKSPTAKIQLKIQAKAFGVDIYRHLCTSLFSLNSLVSASYIKIWPFQSYHEFLPIFTKRKKIICFIAFTYQFWLIKQSIRSFRWLGWPCNTTSCFRWLKYLVFSSFWWAPVLLMKVNTVSLIWKSRRQSCEMI